MSQFSYTPSDCDCRNCAHQLQFKAASGAKLLGTADKTAAVFLLTADPFLWSTAQFAVSPAGIDFPSIHIHGVDLDSYVLFHSAKALYHRTKHSNLSELTD